MWEQVMTWRDIDAERVVNDDGEVGSGDSMIMV